MANLSSAVKRPRIFLERREDLRIEFRDGTATKEIRTAQSGVSLECGNGSRRHVHRSEPEPGDLDRLARMLAGGSFPAEKAEVGCGTAGEPMVRPEAGSVDVANILEIRLPGDGGIHGRIDGRYVEAAQEIMVAAADRPVKGDRRAGSRLWLRVRVARGGREGSAVEEWVRRPGGTLDPAMLVGAAFRRAVIRLDAEPPPGGETAAVFAPGAGGPLIHELIGHPLEGDTAGSGGSLLARETPSFSSREVTVIDDPRRGRVSWKIDDEGEESRAVALVRDGRIAGKIHDRRSAAAWSERVTGHGRRSSYLEPVRPRMGGTFLGAGRLAPDEVVETTAKGIYVRRMEAASVDPASGVACFRVTDADLIRDGRIDRPVTAFLMRADLASTLASLDLVASDIMFDKCVGTCIKDGQPIPISVGTPTFRVGSVRVLKEKTAHSSV